MIAMIRHDEAMEPYGHDHDVRFWKALAIQQERRAEDAERAAAHCTATVVWLVAAFMAMTAAACFGWAMAMGGAK